MPYDFKGAELGKELVLKTFEKLIKDGYSTTAICNFIKTKAKRIFNETKLFNRNKKE